MAPCYGGMAVIVQPRKPAAAVPATADLPEVSPQRAPQPLWLCIRFPRLALDIHPPGNSPVRAVIDANNCVHCVSGAARAVGIETGMPAGAAAALSGVLQSVPRDTRRELRALEQAARRCRRLTPTVSLAPPNAVVLEVRGSLRLFGGFEGIQGTLQAALTPLGHDYHWAAAPTPGASLLLARCRREIKIEGREQLRSVLGGLPLHALDIDTNLLMRLHKTGIRQLRDLWRLPRAGLARRFGPELVAYLDRIRGERPDPRVLYRPPLQFRSQLALPAAASENAMILAAANKLFHELVRFLRRHDAGTAAVCVRLLHQRSSFDSIHVGIRQYARDAAQLLHLFDQALQRRELSEPVTGLEVRCADIRSFTPAPADLFRDAVPQAQQWQHALDELEARLGSESVRHIESVDDHRPENAWIHGVPTGRPAKPQQRPLWLLSQPQRLFRRDRRLWYRGHLTVHSGPERIESGWWDGQDCRRDYYIAGNPRGMRLWIFQDLKQPSDIWYLHGLFG